MDNRAEKVFLCVGRPQLQVDVSQGTLFVRGWDGEEVRVQDSGNSRIRHKGDKILIDSSNQCDIKVYLPRQSDIFVDGTNLEVDLGGVQGFASIDVTDESTSIEDWQGDLEIDSTSGTVRLSQVNGHVEIDTSSGDVEIVASQGNYGIDTGSGSVSISNSQGSLSIDTGSGGIKVLQFKGPVNIDNGSGNIELKGLSGRNVYVDSGSGDIQAILPGASPGSWQLETGKGSITLDVPDNISARFEFQGSDLQIDDLGLERYLQGDEKVTGLLNSGQGRVIASSTSGKLIARKTVGSVILENEKQPDKDEESLKILNMLEQGTITTAEAEELLDALLRGGNDDE